MSSPHPAATVQVMSLTPEQLQALPEHERAQMMALQDELRRGGHMI